MNRTAHTQSVECQAKAAISERSRAISSVRGEHKSEYSFIAQRRIGEGGRGGGRGGEGDYHNQQQLQDDIRTIPSS